MAGILSVLVPCSESEWLPLTVSHESRWKPALVAHPDAMWILPSCAPEHSGDQAPQLQPARNC
jgi:hypothetical protein